MVQTDIDAPQPESTLTTTEYATTDAFVCSTWQPYRCEACGHEATFPMTLSDREKKTFMPCLVCLVDKMKDLNVPQMRPVFKTEG